MATERLTLREKIEREEKKLKTLTEKREELNRKIRKSEQTLNNYRLMENDHKLTAMNELAVNAGISVEDILAALQSGEMLALQEKIEAAKSEPTPDGNADSHGEDGEE